MLRSFIFNEENRWIEEDQILLLHDICLVINSKQNNAYLWKGPEIKKARLKKANESLHIILTQNSDKKWEIIEKQDRFPESVENKINSMLEIARKNKEMGKLKYSRFSTIRITFILLIFIIILKFFSIISNISLLLLPSTTNVYIISSELYFTFLEIYRILTIITLSLFILNLILALIEKSFRTIIFSILGIIIDIGILLLINQGIFLFLFQEDSSENIFFILKLDIITFLIFNLTSISLETIPNIYELFSFYKTYKRYIHVS